MSTVTGMAIWAENGGKVEAGGTGPHDGNDFKDCVNGLVLRNNVGLDARFNTFNDILPPATVISPLPSRCIYVEKTLAQPILVSDNIMKNFKDGVFVNMFKSCTVDVLKNNFKKFNYPPVTIGTLTVYVGSIAVRCDQNSSSNVHIIDNKFNNDTLDFGYNAIRVQNFGPLLFANADVQIRTNTIVNCTIGIKGTGVVKPLIDQQNTVNYTLTAAPTIPCFGIWLNNSPLSVVNDNRVFLSSGITPGPGYANKFFGYSVENGSHIFTITDNKADFIHTGFRFTGIDILSTSGFGCNFMNWDYYGLDLRGDIGDQGTTSINAEDNQWQLPSLSTYPLRYGAIRTSTAMTPVFYSRSALHPFTLTGPEMSPSTAVNFSVTAVGAP
jgi:hypothetical protein